MSGDWVLVCQGLASGDASQIMGMYLHDYDVDAYDGRGTADWTADVNFALRFDSFREAMEAWRAQSTIRPRRGDGKPNRPLTAFHVEPRQVPQAPGARAKRPSGSDAS